ncbi:MAG: hypothetical protein V1792_04530 [Pseudomonadota bacterium]
MRSREQLGRRSSGNIRERAEVVCIRVMFGGSFPGDLLRSDRMV